MEGFDDASGRQTKKTPDGDDPFRYLFLRNHWITMPYATELRVSCSPHLLLVMIPSKCDRLIYSITETAKLNGLNPYYYLEHLLTEIPNLIPPKEKDEPQKMPDRSELEKLLPWSKDLPEKCRVKRR